MDELAPDLRAQVAGSAIARLATVRPDGRPHLVPITFALDGDVIATAVDHKPKTTTTLQRLRNIQANPAVGVLVDHYDDDWSHLWWARADGTARVVTSGAEWERAVTRLVEKYLQYRGRRPRGPAILVSVTSWAVWRSQ